MMKSGIPLVQSFEIVGESLENPSMRELVGQIRDDVAAGNNFADSIRKHPRHFDDLFCNLVDAGEQSGALETMLDRLATYKEKSEALKAKIKKAMNYPIAVVVCCSCCNRHPVGESCAAVRHNILQLWRGATSLYAVRTGPFRPGDCALVEGAYWCGRGRLCIQRSQTSIARPLPIW